MQGRATHSFLALLAASLLGTLFAAPASAQSATNTEAKLTAYGARLTEPEGVEVNSRRVNNRINSRVNARLSTRIQRYTAPANPTDALRAPEVEPGRRAIEQPVQQDEPRN
jgi:hypothetical protein